MVVWGQKRWLCGDRRDGCVGTEEMVVWGQKRWLCGDRRDGCVGTEDFVVGETEHVVE